MPLPPRNAPCPCGSGRKVKRCCGRDRVVAPTRQEKEAALADLAMLAVRSPRLVPLVDGVEGSAARILAGAMTAADALKGLPELEARRLVEAFAELFPDDLAEALERCAEAEVGDAILLGAIVAAGEDHELLAVPPENLEWLEEATEVDAIDAVASTFESWQLWSRAEGAVAEAEVVKIPDWLPDEEGDRRFEAAIEEATGRLYGDWHARRVARMVHEVRQQLPFAEYPRASELLAAGCARFDAEPELGERIAAILLAGALPFEPPVVAGDLLDRLAA